MPTSMKSEKWTCRKTRDVAQIPITQSETGQSRGQYARRNQKEGIVPVEILLHGGVDGNGENSDATGCHYRLHLHQTDVTGHHFEDFRSALQLPQVGLRRQPGRKAHVEVALESQDRRDEDVERPDVTEHFGVLRGKAWIFFATVFAVIFTSTSPSTIPAPIVPIPAIMNGTKTWRATWYHFSSSTDDGASESLIVVDFIDSIDLPPLRDSTWAGSKTENFVSIFTR